jgi:hypothetical protein
MAAGVDQLRETAREGDRRLPGFATLAAAWVALFALTVALYTPYLDAPYFSDDLAFYYYAPPPHLFDYFWMHGSAAHAYRPGEAIILTLIQSHFGMNTLGIHLVAMAAHASLCLMVWMAAWRLGYGRVQALFGGALMLVTQMGAPALLGNDAMSQAVSAALGGAACLILGIACLDYAQNASPKLPRGPLWASALCYFASLFFKETALGLILVMTLFLGLLALGKERGHGAIRLFIGRLLPYGVLIGLYFAARFSAGLPTSGGGQYRVQVGLNVIKNLAQFAMLAVSPISSVAAALAFQGRRFAVLGVMAAAALLIAGTLAAGIHASRRKALAALLAFCVVAALFPALLLGHVSELYVYNAYAYIALLFALALRALANRGYAGRAAMLFCSGLLLAGQVFANRQKASLMNANGEKAAALMASLAPYIQRLPHNGEVWLIRDDKTAPGYSIYILNGLDVLEFGEDRLGPMNGRPDVNVRIVPRGALTNAGRKDGRVVLELRNGSLAPAALPGGASR